MANQNQSSRGRITSDGAGASSGPAARTPGTGATKVASSRPAGEAGRRTAPKTDTSHHGATDQGHVQPRRAERRPEMVKQRRDERRKAYEQRQRQWLYTKIGLGVVGLLAVGGLAWTIISSIGNSTATRPEGTVELAHSANDHTPDMTEIVEYAESPPVGGRHAPPPFWQNCGFYDAPIRNESAVHSMEHGAVWITFRADLPQDQIDEIKDKADQGFVLASPYTEQTEPVVLSAWNNQLRLADYNEDTIDEFVRYFRQGPQTQESGATCSNGVGDPV